MTDEHMRSAAAVAVATGAAVCRIRSGEKVPKVKGWTTRSADPTGFGEGDNLGVVCG